MHHTEDGEQEEEEEEVDEEDEKDSSVRLTQICIHLNNALSIH